MKQALVFDPYIDTLGGGERYTLTFALGLQKNGYHVTLAWPSEKELRLAENRFGLDLKGIEVSDEAFKKCANKTNIFDRFSFTSKYDLIFWVSDGSLPFLFSKNNLVHLQVPFKKLGGNLLINKIKTLFIRKFVYNSIFTQKVHEKNLTRSKSFVLYPPIDTEKLDSKVKKENLILSVGRFDSPSHSKRQDVLIQSFKELYKKEKSYRLVLAGGLKGNLSSVDILRESATDYPISFVFNPSFTELQALYSRAKFFWHAAGFEIDEEISPEKVEHFGMTTVEAMSAGCIPIVIAKGGQKEIIVENKTGFLCNTVEDISKKTIYVIAHPELLLQINKNITSEIKRFNIDTFFEKLNNLL